MEPEALKYMRKITGSTREEWMQLVSEQVAHNKKLQKRIDFRSGLLFLSITLNIGLLWRFFG